MDMNRVGVLVAGIPVTVITHYLQEIQECDVLLVITIAGDGDGDM